jgi:hypothetical protein
MLIYLGDAYGYVCDRLLLISVEMGVIFVADVDGYTMSLNTVFFGCKNSLSSGDDPVEKVSPH